MLRFTALKTSDFLKHLLQCWGHEFWVVLSFITNRYSGLYRFRALFGGDGQSALSRYITVVGQVPKIDVIH